MEEYNVNDYSTGLYRDMSSSVSYFSTTVNNGIIADTDNDLTTANDRTIEVHTKKTSSTQMSTFRKVLLSVSLTGVTTTIIVANNQQAPITLGVESNTIYFTEQSLNFNVTVNNPDLKTIYFNLDAVYESDNAQGENFNIFNENYDTATIEFEKETEQVEPQMNFKFTIYYEEDEVKTYLLNQDLAYPSIPYLELSDNLITDTDASFEFKVYSNESNYSFKATISAPDGTTSDETITTYTLDGIDLLKAIFADLDLTQSYTYKIYIEINNQIFTVYSDEIIAHPVDM